MCYNSWDCACDGPDHECYECNEKEKNLENAKDYLKSILNMLYSKQALDLIALENDIDELCGCIGVKIPQGDLQVSRSQEKKMSMPSILPIVEQWIPFNQQYLKQLGA